MKASISLSFENSSMPLPWFRPAGFTIHWLWAQCLAGTFSSGHRPLPMWMSENRFLKAFQSLAWVLFRIKAVGMISNISTRFSSLIKSAISKPSSKFGNY